MSYGFKSAVKAMDSEVMAKTYSNEDKLIPLNNISPEEETAMYRKLLYTLKILSHISKRDADIFLMSLINKKNQREIGELFNMKQCNVCHTIKKITKKIKVFLDFPTFSHKDLKTDLKKIGLSDNMITVLLTIAQTFSQQDTASLLKINQSRVRTLFNDGLSILTEISKKNFYYEKHVTLFTKIKSNYNIFKRFEIHGKKAWFPEKVRKEREKKELTIINKPISYNPIPTM